MEADMSLINILRLKTLTSGYDYPQQMINIYIQLNEYLEISREQTIIPLYVI